MYKKKRKIFSWIGNGIFFIGYFYVLFVNLSCSFLESADSKTDAVLMLIVAAVVAGMLPGIICWQRCYIRELENRI